jgi:hypothetical protein
MSFIPPGIPGPIDSIQVYNNSSLGNIKINKISEFEIDIILRNLRPTPPPYNGDDAANFMIKIYKNGNIDIKRQGTGYLVYSTIHDKLIINDNIPIPIYIIDMFKSLFRVSEGGPSSTLYECDMNRFIDILQKFKEDFAIIYKKNKLKDNKLNDENDQLKLQIEEVKKENEQLKLQIKETKTNHIINYYC